MAQRASERAGGRLLARGSRAGEGGLQAGDPGPGGIRECVCLLVMGGRAGGGLCVVETVDALLVLLVLGDRREEARGARKKGMARRSTADKMGTRWRAAPREVRRPRRGEGLGGDATARQASSGLSNFLPSVRAAPHAALHTSQRAAHAGLPSSAPASQSAPGQTKLSPWPAAHPLPGLIARSGLAPRGAQMGWSRFLVDGGGRRGW